MVTLILLPGMDGTGTLFDQFSDSLGNEFVIKVVPYPSSIELDYNELETLVLQTIPDHGQRDWVVPTSASMHVSAGMPHATVVSLNAPHLLLQTVPAESARVVGSFIRKIQKNQ